MRLRIRNEVRKPMDDIKEIFGEVISTYSRAQAIEDGVLVDLAQGELGELVREAGIRYPLACTAAVYANYIGMTPAAKKMGNDIEGRMWDVLTMYKYAVRGAKPGQQQIYIHLHCVVKRIVPSPVVIKAVCGPGDTAEPVITLMMPDED
jgi:hypothetical protein